MKIIERFKEHKEKILVMGGATLWLFLSYYLVVTPYKTMRYRNKIKRDLEVRLEKTKKESENIEKIFLKKLEENKKAEKRYEEYEKSLLGKSFENVAVFEEFIQEKIEKNFLQIETIGSIEIVHNNREERGKGSISYEISGSEDNIKKFIEEVEGAEKLLSLTENSVLLENSEKGTKLKLKISGYFLNSVVEKREVQKEEKKIYISFRDFEIANVKIVKINKNKYVVIEYKDKNRARKMLCEDEEIEIDGKLYKVVIKFDGIYLENGERE